jgi:hypothetical protein
MIGPGAARNPDGCTDNQYRKSIQKKRGEVFLQRAFGAVAQLLRVESQVERSQASRVVPLPKWACLVDSCASLSEFALENQ